MDPFLIFVVLGGAVSVSGPLSTLYLNHLLKHSSQNAIRLEQRGETEKAVRYLKWTLFCLSLQPAEIRIHQYMTLGTLYLRLQRFSEGEIQLRSALACCPKLSRPTFTGVTEAQIRANIAFAVEAQGNKEGAATERDRATTCLLNEETRNYSWHLARASDLRQRGQYAEAATEYKIGLQEFPASAPASLRAEELLSLAVCLGEMGHTTKAIFYLEKSLDCSPPADVLADIYFLLAVCCRTLGRLEDAERYYKGVLLSGGTKAFDEIKRETIYWQIGHTQIMRGDLQSARETLTKFSDFTGIPESPYSDFLASELDREDGWFGLSLWRIKRLRQSVKNGSMDAHRQDMLAALDAALRLRTVTLHLLLQEPKNALRELAELEAVNPEAQDNERWGREACEVCALSRLDISEERRAGLQGRVLQIRLHIDGDFTRRVNEGAELADAAAALRSPTDYLAHAALALEMYTVCLELLQRHLEPGTCPVYLPEIYCMIGECQAALGQQGDARAAWQTAVSFGIDTHYSRLASRNLKSL